MFCFIESSVLGWFFWFVYKKGLVLLAHKYTLFIWGMFYEFLAFKHLLQHTKNQITLSSFKVRAHPSKKCLTVTHVGALIDCGIHLYYDGSQAIGKDQRSNSKTIVHIWSFDFVTPSSQFSTKLDWVYQAESEAVENLLNKSITNCFVRACFCHSSGYEGYCEYNYSKLICVLWPVHHYILNSSPTWI